MTVVTVHLVRSPRWRRQRWRWTAKAANGRTIATSGEWYTNKADAVSAIWTLFGPGSFVQLKNPDGTVFVLRSAVDEWT